LQRFVVLLFGSLEFPLEQTAGHTRTTAHNYVDDVVDSVEDKQNDDQNNTTAHLLMRLLSKTTVRARNSSAAYLFSTFSARNQSHMCISFDSS
jgi:predicted transcriptional regulator